MSAASSPGVLHLVRRFLGSLWPGGPKESDETWAQSQLLASEVELWKQMCGPDRRHAVAVARRTVTELNGDTARPIIAAALLHDVGKIEADIGPFRRAIATSLAMITGSQRARSWRGRYGSYLRHDAIGSELLTKAGSDQLTRQWAREHHLSPDRWSVPAKVGAALKSADDD